MGQRHQLFIVSKIQDRYRTLAAVHHQWLYGASATKACWRILQILEHQANKRLINHELAYAATRPDEWWDNLGDDDHQMTPFPVTTTCLLVGAGIDPRPESPYQHDVFPLSIATTLDEVDNNDGITVIDISDLNAVRYCFIFLRNPMAPITGIQYYRTYYKQDGPDIPQPADLEAWDLVYIEALRDLWPHESWEEAEEVLSTACQGGRGHDDSRIKSLRCLAFEKAIRLVAEQPQWMKYLITLEAIPRFHSDLWEFLQAHPNLVQGPGGLRLLGLAMRHMTFLDMSSYPWVTETQILDLIGENSLAEHITFIDLSNNATVDAGSIRKILQTCPGITELSVLCVEGLPLPCLLDSLQGSHVRTVLHSDLFRYPISRADAAAMSRHFRSATKSSHHIVKQAIFFENVAEMRWGLGIPLADAMLDPADVCEWLRQLLLVVAGGRALVCEEELAVPLALSLTVSTTDLWKIKPFPGTLRQWLSSRLIAAEDDRKICYDEIQPGEWTVLFLLGGKLRGKDRHPIFNYVFLTREQDGQLVIADIQEFYRRAVGQQGEGSEAKLATLEQQIRDLQAYLYALRGGNGEPYDILKVSSGSEFVEVLLKVTRSH
jgi:hypothetical protein